MSAATRSSVWALREYCELGRTRYQAEVWVRYGFDRCGQKSSLRFRMKEAYIEYFRMGGSPMALQEAAGRGKPWEQVYKAIRLDEEFRAEVERV